MNTTPTRRNDKLRKMCCIFLVFLGMSLVLSGRADGAVTAIPATVSIDALDQVLVINLLDEGIPIPAAQIRGWRFLAGESDYQRMLDISKRDGALIIAPTRLEMGSYNLVIDTTQGAAHVQVYAPLRSLRNILEMEAAAQGTTVEAIREQRGLQQQRRSATVTIDLPPVYIEGQALDLEMPRKEGHLYRWSINGNVVKEGLGENRLIYVFQRPGDYSLHYEEFRDGTKVAEATVTTSAVPMPEIPWTGEAGKAFTLRAPANYRSYMWKLSGNPISEKELLTYTLSTPGDYQIECIASGAPGGPEGAFVRYRYVIEVMPR